MPRPLQLSPTASGLMNFTPIHVHRINNKTVLFQERQALDGGPGTTAAYWLRRLRLSHERTGGMLGYGPRGDRRV